MRNFERDVSLEFFRRHLASKAVSKTIVKLRRVESQTNGASEDNGQIGGFMAYRPYILILFAISYPSMIERDPDDLVSMRVRR